MSTKLTLTIDKEVIQLAKEYASQKGRSLSDIIENHLRLLTTNKKNKKLELGSITKATKGIARVPKGFDYEKALEDALMEKYLKIK